MRHIECRFNDGPAFLAHYDPSVLEGTPTLSFYGDFGLLDDRVIRVTISITATDESHDLHMRLQDRSPTMASSKRGIRWHYKVSPVAEDAPWLEMLATKHATAMRITGTAA